MLRELFWPPLAPDKRRSKRKRSSTRQGTRGDPERCRGSRRAQEPRPGRLPDAPAVAPRDAEGVGPEVLGGSAGTQNGALCKSGAGRLHGALTYFKPNAARANRGSIESFLTVRLRRLLLSCVACACGSMRIPDSRQVCGVADSSHRNQRPPCHASVRLSGICVSMCRAVLTSCCSVKG